jgi:hypothetical protein
LTDPKRVVALAACLACSLSATACRNIDGFSTASGGHYEGTIVGASFVRAGLGSTVKMCLLLDTDHLQDTPGSLSTDDGLFTTTSLRPIPQFWQDPLSTLNFGEGRIKNVVYVARGAASDAGPAGDIIVVLSLMAAGDIEVRLVRGAPSAMEDGGAPEGPRDLFGVFALSRASGPCPF